MTAGRLAGARVLVVDDERAMAENLAEILSDEGAAVRVFARAADVCAAPSDDADLALIDVNLPDATGVELLAALKGRNETLEVLLITGDARVEHAIAAVEAGAYAYVLKPFDPDALIANVVRALERVRLRRQAAALQAALAENEQQLRGLVDAVHALLLELDADGRVQLANHAVATAVGRPLGEIVGADWFETFVGPADRARARQIMLGGMQALATVPDEDLRLVRHAGGDGRAGERWIRWRSTAVSTADGRRRVYAFGLDVTDVRELERRTKLAEKLAAVGTLAAGLAHEIRNPLNAATLQLQLLERRVDKALTALPAGGDTEALRERLTAPVAVVQGELGRLAHLVQDFLNFARPQDLMALELDLCAVVHGVVELVLPEAEAKGVTLVLQEQPPHLHIRADREKLRQVFLNLIRNAIEAVEDSRGKVFVSCRRDGAGARVIIHDDGPGIPEAHLGRIFEPFFSTKEMGTGLGMAICHSLIELHGGAIDVRNEGGACVTVTLPSTP